MGFFRCVIYLAVTSVTIFLCGRFYPRKWIFEDSFPYKSFSFEKEGSVYDKIKIRRWKTKWPDASMVFYRLFPKHYPKKRIENGNVEKIPVLIKESCVAETTHVIASILGFGCIYIWRGAGGIIMSVLYLIPNIPPVIIQRYNRPRLKKFTASSKKTTNIKSEYTVIEDDAEKEFCFPSCDMFDVENEVAFCEEDGQSLRVKT